MTQERKRRRKGKEKEEKPSVSASKNLAKHLNRTDPSDIHPSAVAVAAPGLTAGSHLLKYLVRPVDTSASGSHSHHSSWYTAVVVPLPLPRLLPVESRPHPCAGRIEQECSGVDRGRRTLPSTWTCGMSLVDQREDNDCLPHLQIQLAYRQEGSLASSSSEIPWIHLPWWIMPTLRASIRRRWRRTSRQHIRLGLIMSPRLHRPTRFIRSGVNGHKRPSFTELR